MLALCSLLASLALAQTTTDTTVAVDPGVPVSGFDAHGFRLVSFDADPRDPLTFQRPKAFETGSWYAGAMGEYASRPLVFEPTDGTTVTALSNVVAANLAAGVVPSEFVRFDLSVPLFLASTGEAGSQGAGLGDVRVSSLFVAPLDIDGLGLGLVAALDVPTGDPGAYLGSTGVGGLLGVTGSYMMEQVTLSSRVGARLAPNSDPDIRPAPTEGGDTVEVAGAVGYALDESTGFTVEADVSLPLDPAVQEAIGIPAEAILSVRHVRPAGGHISGGVGVGLGQGAGASPVRLLIGGGFGSASGGVRDADGDGLADRDDACPEEAETVNGFQDEDGCADTLPTLTVRATLDGQPVAAAFEATVDGAASRSEGERFTAQAVPGVPVAVTARMGQCLVATRELSVGEVDATVDLVLETVRTDVAITVTNEAGDLLEGAQVRYLIDDEHCLPSDRNVPGGKATHAVGPGTYEVYVSAPGYDLFTGELVVEAGTPGTLDVKLAPQ